MATPEFPLETGEAWIGLAAEIAEDLRAALEQFESIAQELGRAQED